MKSKTFKVCSLLLALLIVASVVVGCTPQSGEQTATSTITDMAGRIVEIPAEVNTVVTVGSVPVMNGFIFAMGEGDKIVNGLPAFAQGPRWKYQTVFAPQIADGPVLQGANSEINLEELLQVNPDVVFTMSASLVETVEASNIPVVFLDVQNQEDWGEAFEVMGAVFDNPSAASDYIDYFDDTLSYVNEVVSSVPTEERPRVLYCLNLNTVNLPIVDWWIEAAGGISVRDYPTASYEFDAEQLLQWNPEIWVVSSPDEFNTVYDDARFSDVDAVKNNRVYISPIGTHIWCRRTAELPLTVLWAAQTFYPDKFEDLDFEEETMDFYQKFFKYDLSREEAQEIISGRVGEE